MRTISRVLLACLFLASLAFPAAARPVDCKLVVNGKAYINGVCEFEASQGGSFTITGDKYFAYVNVSGNKAEASWNADPASTHAQAPLGTLERKGGCWVSRTVEICARNLDPKKLAAATADRPNGVMIYPDFPGASQSCLSALGGRWEVGAAVVLGNCKVPADKRFVRSGDTIAIDKRAGLCVDAAPNGKLVLGPCQSAAKWDTGATSSEAQAVRSRSGTCWAIPALADDKAKFPFEAVVVPCSPDASKNLKFFFAKD
jgi:hypothetical protein